MYILLAIVVWKEITATIEITGTDTEDSISFRNLNLALIFLRGFLTTTDIESLQFIFFNYSSLNSEEEYDKSKQEVSESEQVSCSTISVILALSPTHV